MAKQAMLFGLHKVANKKHLFTKAAITRIEFPVKKIQFFVVTKFCTLGSYTEKMLLADASKIIRNWFLKLQLDAS